MPEKKEKNEDAVEIVINPKKIASQLKGWAALIGIVGTLVTSILGYIDNHNSTVDTHNALVRRVNEQSEVIQDLMYQVQILREALIRHGVRIHTPPPKSPLLNAVPFEPAVSPAAATGPTGSP